MFKSWHNARSNIRKGVTYFNCTYTYTITHAEQQAQCNEDIQNL